MGADLRLRIERAGVSFARLAALADIDSHGLYRNSLPAEDVERVKAAVARIERGEVPAFRRGRPGVLA